MYYICLAAAVTEKTQGILSLDRRADGDLFHNHLGREAVYYDKRDNRKQHAHILRAILGTHRVLHGGDKQRERHLVLAAQQNQRHHVAVPRTDERENTLGHQSGTDNREHHPVENADLPAAVHISGFDDLRGKASVHELLEEENAEAVGGRGNQERNIGIEQAHLGNFLIKADDAELAGHHHHDHNHGEQEIAALKLEF